MRPLNIPVILGTSRKGRMSAHAARFIVDLLNHRAGVTSTLVNFGTIGKLFDDSGRLLDEAFVRRSDKFVRELIWMAKALRYGREQVTIDEEAAVTCDMCGAMMNHHGDKPMMADTPEDAPSPLASMHACPACGNQTAVIGAPQPVGEPA